MERKRHHSPPTPLVTLYFDQDKCMTIAVLSRHIESLDVYFQCRVAQGLAVEVSPLYYELEGYVRENRARIQRQQGFSPGSIVVALGALEVSDEAQKKELTDDRNYLLRQRLSSTESRPRDHMLEEVLEIARLHRLSNDLDALSVYFMRQTSRVLRKVATRIAEDHLQAIHLKLTPFVDGGLVSGYSRFVRDNSTSQLVRITESGSKVEYKKAPDIELVYDGCSKSCSTTTATFVPNKCGPHFSWKCEELALANLHRWWGDIAIHDYVGQKLVLVWMHGPGSADSVNFQDGQTNLASYRMEAEISPGRRKWPSAHTEVTIDVTQSENVATDDVTTVYAGRSSVEKVHVDYLSLVRPLARIMWEKTKWWYKQIEVDRPLLDYEIDYVNQIKEVAGI